ncbi:hypothetical protein CDD81_8040 [Ophiocordyceps australis]|uniref:WD repeat-containing protein JIP5 n=1 Tax=Ophiocordyceps australis TaxID=1399860 RepID=A0A2C5XWQ8_9HYPO|nr:hypothetical protein CDD81_8040 [Ophiocordyceps australis]
MFQNICTFPADKDIVAAALHPLQPRLTIGLVDGVVESFDLSHGKKMVASLWRTKRHKGTCRCIAYSPNGQDSVVKQFDAETGQVTAKMAVPYHKGQADMPILLHVVSHQSLLLATDSGRLHVYDLGSSGSHSLPLRPVKTVRPHGSEYVSSITPVPGAARLLVTTGGSNLAVTDPSSGKVVRSEDQEDELLSSVFMPGLGPKGKRSNGVVLVGTGDGFLTLWDRGAWDDQLDRINVCAARGAPARHAEAIDALARVPDALRLGKAVVCGMGDGSLQFVDVQARCVLRDLALRHDGVEGVTFVGFDEERRLVSVGGAFVKIWQDLSELEPSCPSSSSDDDDGNDGNDDNDDNDDDDNDNDNNIDNNMDNNMDNDKRINGKRLKAHGHSDSGSDSDSDALPTSNKRKRGNKNLGPMGAHGVLGFQDMD